MPNILLVVFPACIVAFKGEYDADHPQKDPRDTTLITYCVDSGIVRDLLDLTGHEEDRRTNTRYHSASVVEPRRPPN
ncbi:hypothetical protein GB937_005123 [Aspergillus fischeri]|nr:hypothetical protein GB937_005123 [Aspergillus fischeri]